MLSSLPNHFRFVIYKAKIEHTLKCASHILNKKLQSIENFSVCWYVFSVMC